MLKHLISLIIFVLLVSGIFGQETEKHLKMKKNSKKQKEILIAPHSRFKAKTLDGIKIIGTLDLVCDNCLIYNKTDTLFYKKICWIKAKRNISKTTGFLALGGVIVGGIYTAVMIPGSFMIFIFNANPLIFLVPVATYAITHISVTTLAGRRFKTQKWSFLIE